MGQQAADTGASSLGSFSLMGQQAAERSGLLSYMHRQPPGGLATAANRPPGGSLPPRDMTLPNMPLPGAELANKRRRRVRHREDTVVHAEAGVQGGSGEPGAAGNWVGPPPNDPAKGLGCENIGQNKGADPGQRRVRCRRYQRPVREVDMRGDQSVNSDLGESNQVGQREGACNWTYDNAHLYDERYYDRLADLFHPPERNPDRDIHLDDDNRMYYYSPSTEVRDVTVGAGVIAQKMRKVYGNQVDADLPQKEFLLRQM